eukprot:CAMPEP_0117422416 /NCGR_PEP_ID=MMETSP0758-20121206/3259_1 /TAXON_ID=63605 /ORGANISM="Percolomonas cosmopolitus, Strain AE-1 (ATCC 50343)" /LENGTH=478 /DNA_ID=CAMNT_0005205021 /DNA_START=101 /DNA_END=1539 /DNA_ORIENTATION=+
MSKKVTKKGKQPSKPMNKKKTSKDTYSEDDLEKEIANLGEIDFVGDMKEDPHFRIEDRNINYASEDTEEKKKLSTPSKKSTPSKSTQKVAVDEDDHIELKVADVPVEYAADCTIVYSGSPKFSDYAKTIASHTNKKYSEDLENLDTEYILQISENHRMTLQRANINHFASFSFSDYHKRYCIGSKMEPLETLLKKPAFKAFQRAKKHLPQDAHIIDVTGGMGLDAYIYASRGYEVTVLERDPIVYSLLVEGKSIDSSTPGVAEILSRITFLNCSAESYFKDVAEKNDDGNVFIYMDPWYYDGYAHPTERKTIEKNIEAVMRGYTNPYTHESDVMKMIESLSHHHHVILKQWKLGRPAEDPIPTPFAENMLARFGDRTLDYQLYLKKSDPRLSDPDFVPLTTSSLLEQKKHVANELKRHQTKKIRILKAKRKHDQMKEEQSAANKKRFDETYQKAVKLEEEIDGLTQKIITDSRKSAFS